MQLKIEQIYKEEANRVLATLIRILGSFDLAEEALQEAFQAALEKWPQSGIPENPYSWLVSVGKFKTIDAIRKSGRGREILEEILTFEQDYLIEEQVWDKHIVEDDQLRLIFICCHPQLPLDSRIALSLREVCGMPTEEIASAYLVSYDTIKKRISRAKALIKERKIPYELPLKEELTNRVNAVKHVIYLIFNEGYSASAGENYIREELIKEAIFLSRKLVDLMPSSESFGLLALLILHQSRIKSRVNQSGAIIPLEQQDRSLWNQSLIREGIQLIQNAVMSGPLGPYTLQAAIASVHAVADSVQNTQWGLIVGYYDILLSIHPSPIVELNRAIAIGMHESPEASLKIIENLLEDKKLISNHLIYAAHADSLKKLGKNEQAINAYHKALKLVRQKPEEEFLKKQLSEIIGN